MMPRMVRRLLAKPPSELLGRSAQELRKLAERALPTDAASSLSVADGADALGQFMRGTTAFFAGARDGAVVDALRRHAPEHVQAVLALAHGTVDGNVPLLGFGTTPIGNPPQWHREPISGHVAPRLHWSRVPYLDRGVVGDHKILWEFNRQQYLLAVAQAWRLTGDDRWLTLIRTNIESWQAENPPRSGVNWASSLEVAYRSIAWLWTLAICGAEAIDALGPDFLGRTLQSLRAHGRHVERYLSHWFSPNTHLTGEALGLLYLATALPQLPESTRWNSLARSILEAQAFIQIGADGVYFEQATQYHRYTADIYQHALILAEKNGQPFAPTVRARVHQLFTVLRALQRPDGSIALVGDDDGGRLLPLDDEPPHDVTGLLTTASIWLGDPTLRPASRVSHVERLWLLGQTEVPEPRERSGYSVAFPHGGQFVIADPDARGGHMTLQCGPHGALSCGHAHADALACEYWTGGSPVLVDAGTGAYDGPLRNCLRVTRAHNTLELGGESASIPALPFSWAVRTDAVVDGWVNASSWTWFEGHHDGYERLAPGARHSRVVWRATSGLWIIEDRVDATQAPEAVVRWHVATGVKVHHSASLGAGIDAFELRGPGSLALSLVVVGASSATVESATISPRYGRCETTQCLRLGSSVARGLRILSIVVDWERLPASTVQIHRAGAGPVTYHEPHGHVPSEPLEVLLDGNFNPAWPPPPVALVNVMAVRHPGEHGRLLCVGSELATTGASAQRDRWYEYAPARDGVMTWTGGSLRSAGV